MDIKGRMTKKRALEIRRIRVEEEYTWRAVARHCHKLWGDAADWDPPSNQLAGMALCKLAAKVFNEDYYDNDWN